MPASHETVPNRPLSGDEVRQIILKDVDNILTKDGMFAGHMGYGRISYRIRVEMQLDNPQFPEHKVEVTSRNPAKNFKPEDPRRSVAAPPMKSLVEGEPGAPSDIHSIGVQRERVIDSPNHARLEHGLPITIDKKDLATGEIKPIEVNYDAAGLPPGPKTDTDISDEVRTEWEAE